MSGFFRMTWFHARRLWGTTFFVQVLFFSTLQVVCLQALSNRAGLDPGSRSWMRGALVGMWSVSTLSSGIIGFQRFNGTLVHLVRSPRAAWRVLGPVVAGVSTFGLLAVPISFVSSILLRLPVGNDRFWQTIGGFVLFWFGALVMSALVSTVFVLSRYATTYEALIGIPLILLSGVFGRPAGWHWVDVASGAMPTAWAVQALFGTGSSPITVLLGYVLSVCGWALVAAVASRAVVNRAVSQGTLELI